MLRVEYEARTRGIPFTYIASACGVSKSLVSRVVRGNEKPYPKLRDGIAVALDWPLDQAATLFEEIEIGGE